MRTRSSILAAALAAVVGCGAPTATPPHEAPLTVEQWKALPAQTKYEVETLERLKLGDPKLQDQRVGQVHPRGAVPRQEEGPARPVREVTRRPTLTTDTR